MTLDKIILDDFLTYEHLEYSFEDRPQLVQGLNKTDEGQKSNGSGKSGIQTAIEFCITASNSRDVRDNELVTYGQKQARVQLFASCNIRKERLHIDWTINTKGSNKLTLMKKSIDNDWEEVSFSNVNDGKKYILAWFAISKEDLFNYYIINKSRFKSFFKSSQKEKVDLINRFSDASIISGLEEVDTESLDKEYRIIEDKINGIESIVERNVNKIEEEKGRDLKAEVSKKQGELECDIEELEEEIELREGFEKKVDEEVKDVEYDIKNIKDDKEIAKKDRLDIEKDIETQDILVKEWKEKSEAAEKILNDFKRTDWDIERQDFEADLDVDSNQLDKAKGHKKKEQEDFEEREEEILKFIKTIDIKLSGTIECPECSHEFILTKEDETIEELKEKKEKIKVLQKKKEVANDEKKAEFKKEINALNVGIGILETELSEISKKEKVENADREVLVLEVSGINTNLSHQERKANRLTVEINQVDADLGAYDRDIDKKKLEIENIESRSKNRLVEIENYKKSIKNINKEIKALKPDDNKSTIKGLKFENSLLEKDKEAKQANLAEVGDKIFLRKQWQTNFKKFRMHLANQSLEAISHHCNRYLQGMNSDMTVEFEGFRILANGTIKEEITAKVIRGIERSFSSFSGGEQGRLLFAAILANRHMINSSHPYGGLDFLSVDEVFEGVDSLGLKYLINSAKTLGVSVMIITHVTDEDTNDDILLVVKENGVSRIEK